MAGFQLIIRGRFWVIDDTIFPGRVLPASSLALELVMHFWMVSRQALGDLRLDDHIYFGSAYLVLNVAMGLVAPKKFPPGGVTVF